MSKLSIVHVVESLFTGGLERVVLELAAQQQEDGHSVKILCLFQSGTLAAEANKRSLHVVQCGKRKGLDWTAMKKIKTECDLVDADVVHTHNAMAHYYAVAALLRGRSPMILNTRHGMGAARPRTARELFYKIASIPIDHQVAVCEAGMKEFVKKRIFSGKKSRVVYNGIRLSNVIESTAERRQVLRQELGIDKDCLIVGTVGRLSWAKDHSNLLKAFALLKTKNINVHLLIVGSGKLQSVLEKEASDLSLSDNLSLVGERHDVPQLLAGMDIFTLASLTEGYSVALLEAMAAGLPAIASSVGGNHEIVDDGLTGFIVPASDPSSLAEAIEKLSKDAFLREEIGSHARSVVLSRNTVRAMTDGYYKLYPA